MKYLPITLFLLFVLNFASCKILAEYTQFDMTYSESILIKSSTGVHLPINVASRDVETNSKSTFEVNDTRKDLIEEILIKSLTLDLISPSNGDFSFLESISIYIDADGLKEIKIAWIENITKYQEKSLNLNATTADLKEYIKKDKFDLRINCVTDEFLTSDHELRANLKLHVDAEVAGL